VLVKGIVEEMEGFSGKFRMLETIARPTNSSEVAIEIV
jgi:hypothetical protein